MRYFDKAYNPTTTFQLQANTSNPNAGVKVFVENGTQYILLTQSMSSSTLPLDKSTGFRVAVCQEPGIGSSFLATGLITLISVCLDDETALSNNMQALQYNRMPSLQNAYVASEVRSNRKKTEKENRRLVNENRRLANENRKYQNSARKNLRKINKKNRRS